MRADILKRIEALEAMVNPLRLPVLTTVEIHRLPDADRDAYWNGDPDVLNRYEAPVADLPPGTITTIVIDVGAASRDEWERTRNMSDDEYEQYDEARIQEDEEPARPAIQKAPEPKFDQWGYRIS